ncbi:MAG: DUF4012 domain-containing protein [Patescibacteria group bacterium]|nr:DUF4012 domain-containing protein [Patescibacteria group bacterium]
MSENTIKNSQFTEKKKRGRPRKVFTADELLALQNKPKRPRGRPKKEWTPEELAALAKMEKRERGRPHKVLSPQEEWLLKYAPKKGARGRPHKNFVMDISLPRVLISLAENDEKIEKKLPEIENKMEEIEKDNKVLPQMTWQEFKAKINISELPSELPENYIFPVTAEPLVDLPQESKLKIKNNRRASAHVVDLRAPKFKDYQIKETTETAPLTPMSEVKYLWEEEKQSTRQKHVREILGFDMPEDAANLALKADLKKINKQKKKIKKVKVDLISSGLARGTDNFIAVPATPRTHGFFYWTFDLPLTLLGKFIYFFWQALTAPFRLLDFVVDHTLKGVWAGLTFVVRQITKLFKFNISYLIRSIGYLFKKREAPAMVLAERKFSLKPLINFGLTALIIVLPLLVWNSWRAAQKTQGDVLGTSSQGLNYLEQAAGNFSENDITAAVANFGRAESAFYLAQKQIKELGPLTNSLIKLVPKARDGEKLLAAGQYLSASAQKITQALSVFNAPEPALTEKISFLHQTIGSEETKINAALNLINEIDKDSLPSDAQEKFSALQIGAKNWQTSIAGLKDILLFSQDILGAETSKRYLVVFQNSNELRPTGGFMGSFAVVDVDKGRVKKMDIPGGGLYDLKSSSQVLVAAPKPLQIFSPAWQIWNANWFPNWPTSAEKIIWFYENNYGGSSVDGIISLTQDTVANLLKIVGPIEMKEYKQTLSAENFTIAMQTAVELEYDKNKNRPKEIIADMAPVLLERLMNLNTKDYLPVLAGLSQALSEEKILFYFSDKNTEDLAERFGWAGKIRATENNQDYLMVVHTNISGGKTDAVIKNTVRHSVEVDVTGAMVATVSLTRQHNGELGKLFEGDNNVDYVRFYVPAGAELISATGFNFNPDYLFKYSASQDGMSADKTLAAVETNVSLDEATGTRVSSEFGKTVFGNWLQVAPGQEKTVTIKYKLPFQFGTAKSNNKIKQWFAALFGKNDEAKYSLVVDKQLGMNAIDFQSELILPANYKIQATAGSGVAEEGSVITYSADLLKDGYFGVVAER